MNTRFCSIAPGYHRLAAALAAAALVIALTPAGVRAQSYPSKPITIVVPLRREGPSISSRGLSARS